MVGGSHVRNIYGIPRIEGNESEHSPERKRLGVVLEL